MRIQALSLFALVLGGTPVASAQTVVVPASVGTAPDADLRGQVSAGLGEQDVSVVPAEALEERLGLESPRPVPPEVARQLGQDAETVLEQVARGETAQAIERGQAALMAARPHLAAIGRDPQAGTDLANICLYVVRAELGDGEAATARARECWRLVPDLPVEDRLHPPEVRSLVERVRVDIDSGRAVLSVTAPPSEAGCQVRLHGRVIGETPSVRRAVVPGTYSLQLECGQSSGPIRTVQVDADAAQRVSVRPGLETALRFTDAGPVLVYGSPEQAAERIAADAAELARAAGAIEAIAALAAGGDVHLYRVAAPSTGPARLLADTSVAASPDAVAGGIGTILGATDTGVTLAAGPGEPADTSRPVVGPLLLGTAGLGALAVVGVGLLQEGCVEEDAAGACLEERQLSTSSALLYGGVGVAALAGAILWFALGGGPDEPEEGDVDVAVGPGSVDVSVVF